MQLPQYFQTDNTALANALSLCGCQAPKDEQGNPMPQAMVYNRAILKKLGYHNMSLDEAARQAVRDRKPGTRIFQFERSELAQKIENAFNAAHAAMEKGEDIHIEELNPEHVAQIVYAANRMRRRMLSNYRVPTFLSSDSDLSTNKTDTGMQAAGKFTCVAVQV